jgi:hypothetical protein
MKVKTLIAMAVAGAFAVPCAVLAQSTSTGAAARSTDVMQRLDRNNDGFVTRDEAKDATELQGRFAELDKDNDGKISAAEMSGMDADRSATGATGVRGSTGGMGGSSGPAGTSSGPNPAGEAPRGGVSR